VSSKVYTILSKNKEQGPYSLEEILQISLKPQDLIWEEGSVGWRSPSEIGALQPYLNTSENKLAAHTSRIFISYPKNTQATTTRVASLKPEINFDGSTSTLENEEERTAESLEIKADKIYQRVLAYNNQKQLQQESLSSEGTYTLQELRQEYALRLQGNTKKNNIKSRKKLLKPAGIAGIIASALFFAIRSTTVENNTSAPPTPLYTTNTTYPVTTKALNTATPEALNNKQNIRSAPVKKDTVLSAPVTKSKELSVDVTKELSVDEFIDSIRQVMARQDRLNGLPRRKNSSN